MLGEGGQVKIMDFGLAKVSGKTRLTKTATVMGTVAYMSPEQARGDSAIDHRSDLWSLGVLLYEMLTDTLPFDAETDTGVIYKIIHEDPLPVTTLRSEVPETLERAIQKSMNKDFQARYEDVGDLITDLEAVKSEERGSAEQRSPSIVVLPFINMSADPEQEYFCDGLAEELINALAQIKDLHVVARTSAFSFKDKQLDVRDIGRKLNVGTILEGSVRKAGNRLRITAQLVKVDDGYHLWSERFDREMDDVFAIQDEISETIVGMLKVKLLKDEKAKLARRQTVDLEAYNLYLKGRWLLNYRTAERLTKAIECFKQSVEKAPDYAPAYAGLVDSYIVLSFFGPFPPKETHAKAKEAALKALEIDDTLAGAHSALAGIKQGYDWDWEGAEREFKRAIELNPSCAEAHRSYAYNLLFMTRFDEALEEIKRARELDPLSLAIGSDEGIMLALAGRYDQAIESLKNTIAMDPNNSFSHATLGFVYFRRLMYEEAMTELSRARNLSEDWDVAAESATAGAYAVMGQRDKAEELLDRLLERSKQIYIPSCFLALIHFFLGETDRAFEWFDRAYEERDHWLCFLKADPVFDMLGISADPRYLALLRKIGLDK
jgi:serine/threonine-protein kinase